MLSLSLSLELRRSGQGEAPVLALSLRLGRHRDDYLAARPATPQLFERLFPAGGEGAVRVRCSTSPTPSRASAQRASG